MAAPLFHPQSWYFYTHDWTEEIDKKFIAVLEAQAKLGNMVHSKIDALFIAREEVNDTFGTNFPLHTFRQRLYKLSNRYAVFKKITGYSGVAWDKDDNVIRASPDCWLTWIKDMPLTKAYIYQGESAWDALDVIFGKQREYQELVNEEVIEISSDDDDDPTNGHNGLRIIVENDEDEVNSPPQKIPVIEIDPPHVQIQPGDDGSTNMLPQRYFVDPIRVSKCLSTSKVPPPRCLFAPPLVPKVEKEDKPSPKSPPDMASSTASCSPAKTLKYMFV